MFVCLYEYMQHVMVPKGAWKKISELLEMELQAVVSDLM